MAKIKFRRDTAAAWTQENPTLAQGEPGFEHDTGLFKIGDGATAWTSLDYSGGGAVQPYLELTNDPFIIQPVVLGTPVTVSTPGNGSGASFEVIIGEGPVITSITITVPGTDYIVGQRYRVWGFNIGGTDINRDSIVFEVETVGAAGELLTISNAAFTGAATNTPITSYTNADYQASPGDVIDSGVTLVRGSQGALFNIEEEAEYDDNSYVSPIGTEWNSDGWGNLVNLQSRSYGTFRLALNNNVGENIIGAELVMHDTINDQYYKFSFSNWGHNNGGSYAYTRTLVEDPNYFKKTNYGSEVDIIIPDDGEGAGVGITRGNNNGIYNPYREGSWDEDFSPGGTVWNTDGWDDLSNVLTRTYTNFYDAYNGNLGNRVPGSQAVMYVPDNDTYYAVQWLGWTQGGAGGGFSYLRYELDLTQLQQGITFPDGTVLNSAEGIGRVKLASPGNRRIEEVHGYKSVSLTERNRTEITGATRSSETAYEVKVKKTTEINAFISPYYNTGAVATWYISFDNVTFRPVNLSGYGADYWWFYYVNANGPTLQIEDAAFYIRRDVGGAPVTWWSSADLPGSSGNFRGAVIDYHAYTGEATIIGTMHIVDDNGEEHITHTEVSSGGSDSENDELWLVQNEGTISYRRIDGESKTLKIQWTAKVFYGSELYD